MYMDFRSDAQHEHDIREAHALHVAPFTEDDDDIVFTLRKLDEARVETQSAKFGFSLRLAVAIEVAVGIALLVVLR